MQPPYRLIGAELSPYSVKVRSYLRYKGIAHTWVPRGPAVQAEFQKYAKLPLVPLIVGADETAMQDSTPIIERLEAAHPELAITPPDPRAAFVSALLEEFADEWLNKAMFHFRWAYEADQLWAAKRIVDMMTEGAPPPDRRPVEAAVRERMIGRLSFVGSNSVTGPFIERSFRRFADMLEAHLRGRPYLFGHRPALADFGVFGQMYELLSDPTPGGILRAHHPHVVDYIDRMLEPAPQGEWDDFDTLAPTLTPILQADVRVFLRWSAANAAAGDAPYTVDLDGAPFSQEPQKYAVKSLATIRAKYAAAKRDDLDALLGAEAVAVLAG